MVTSPGLRTDTQNANAEKRSLPSIDLDPEEPTKQQMHRATRTRMIWSVVTSACLFISFILLVVVEVGSTSTKSGVRDIWFLKLNLANVVPSSFPNSFLLNSIARSLGLHDFYTVGLWNFCEGYNDQGYTDCAPSQACWWFDPVSIVKGQLLAGASSKFSVSSYFFNRYLGVRCCADVSIVQLPPNVNDILNLIKVASHVMFGLFLTGTVLSFVLITANLFSVYSRWLAFLIAVLNFLNALFITVASVVATVMFVIMQQKVSSQTEINVEAQIGKSMFAVMWVAATFAIFAFLVQLCLTCCCASRRDVKKGKKRGSRKAYDV